jgi:hypothetical protein
VLTLHRAQITHGRVAMLAALGWVVQERWHPLFDGAIEGATHFNPNVSTCARMAAHDAPPYPQARR